MANSSPHARLYNSTRWRNERAAFIARHPLCADHLGRGHVEQGAVVDHKRPHQGDLILFWDQANWQTLCKPCHDSHKQRLERSTITAACTLDGTPTDPRHPWAAGR